MCDQMELSSQIQAFCRYIHLDYIWLHNLILVCFTFCHSVALRFGIMMIMCSSCKCLQIQASLTVVCWYHPSRTIVNKYIGNVVICTGSNLSKHTLLIGYREIHSYHNGLWSLSWQIPLGWPLPSLFDTYLLQMIGHTMVCYNGAYCRKTFQLLSSLHVSVAFSTSITQEFLLGSSLSAKLMQGLTT